MKIDREKMRYRVPNKYNRFFAVHLRFIVICFVLALMATTVALSYFTIQYVNSVRSKSFILFMGKVEDPERAMAQCERISVSVNVYLVAYEERFLAAEGSENKYDFAEIGDWVGELYEDSWERETTAVVCLGLSSEKVYSYSDLYQAGLIASYRPDEEVVLTLDQITAIVRRLLV